MRIGYTPLTLLPRGVGTWEEVVMNTNKCSVNGLRVYGFDAVRWSLAHRQKWVTLTRFHIRTY